MSKFTKAELEASIDATSMELCKANERLRDEVEYNHKLRDQIVEMALELTSLDMEVRELKSDLAAIPKWVRRLCGVH